MCVWGTQHHGKRRRRIHKHSSLLPSRTAMGRVAVQPQSCQLPIPPVVFADCGSQQDDKASASEAGRERRNSEAGWQCEWLGGQGSRCVVRWARALARPTSIASSPPFASSSVRACVSLFSSLLAFSRPLASSAGWLFFSFSLSLSSPRSLYSPPLLSLSLAHPAPVRAGARAPF